MTPRTLPLLLAVLVALPATLAALALPATAEEPAAVEQVTVTSFDGTPLAATMFTPPGADADAPVPYVLMTHGWAGSRVTTPTGRVADLLEAGYGVLTWDSRGFGASGGEVMLDHPDYEGRDVRVLVDWLVQNAPVAMEAPDDPRVGMSGGSYAGGIQLLAAAFDPRIDAIAPEITWNDLAQALAPNGVPKLGWVTALFGAGAATSCSDGHRASLSGPSGCQTSALARYYATVMATNGVTDEIREALWARSPARYMDQIQVPTLVVQGFPDTLFDVDQAVANYVGVKANGQPAKLWLHDGGHALPGTSVPNTQTHLVSQVVVAWMDCHLAPAPDCARVGPEVEYYTGTRWLAADAWPIPDMTRQGAHANGIPPLLFGPTPAGAPGTAAVPLAAGPAEGKTVAVGGARVEFLATVLGTEARLFASLGVRDATGAVVRVSEQVAPLRLAADDAPTRYALDLVDVAAEWGAGETLVLTLTTADPVWNNARAAGFLYLEDVDVVWLAAEI